MREGLEIYRRKARVSVAGSMEAEEMGENPMQLLPTAS